MSPNDDKEAFEAFFWPDELLLLRSCFEHCIGLCWDAWALMYVRWMYVRRLTHYIT